MSTVATSISTAEHAAPEISFKREPFSGRSLFSASMSVLAGLLSVLAAVPLLSVLYMLIRRGGERLWVGGTWIFTQTPPGAMESSPAGGFGNAIVGTVVMVVIACLIAVPFGILAAILLTEFGRETKAASIIRFCAKVLSGFPSILAGIFSYAVVVALLGYYSALAGGVALSVLMLPIVMLTAEEAIKLVPEKMRQAAIGMGATPAQVVWHVTIPTALPGILTGVMLAVARAAGETAPLLFTALFSMVSWPVNGQAPYVHVADGPTASMAVFIYNSSGSFADNLRELAWACSLVLVIMVLIFNIGGQLVSRNSHAPR